jgi:hypothetical protein
MIQRRRPALILIAVIGSITASCATLPDTTGYTTSTVQMKQAVDTAGQAVETELRATASLIPGDSQWKQSADGFADQFHDPWATTVVSLNAMVSYAQSIEAIVGAGNKGRESANAVAGSLTALASNVGIPVASPAIDAVINTAGWIYGQIARAQAARSLQEALDRAGPAISGIQTHAIAQVQDARRVFELGILGQLQELQRAPRYQPFVEANARLITREAVLNMQVSTLIANNSADGLAPLQAQLEQAVAARALLAPHLEEYEAKVADVRARERAGLALLAAAETALASWAESHENLVRAVRERRPVTMESLTESVRDVRALIQQWREL